MKNKYYREVESNRELRLEKRKLKRENSILKEELEIVNKKVEEYSLLLMEALKKGDRKWQ